MRDLEVVGSKPVAPNQRCVRNDLFSADDQPKRVRRRFIMSVLAQLLQTLQALRTGRARVRVLLVSTDLQLRDRPIHTASTAAVSIFLRPSV